MPNCNLATSSIGAANLIDPALGTPGLGAPVNGVSTASASILNLQLVLPVLQQNVFIQSGTNSPTLVAGFSGNIAAKSSVAVTASGLGLQLPLNSAALATALAVGSSNLSYGTTGLAGGPVALISATASADLWTRNLSSAGITGISSLAGDLLGRQLEASQIAGSSSLIGTLVDDLLSTQRIISTSVVASAKNTERFLIGLAGSASAVSLSSNADLVTKSFAASVVQGVASASGSGYLVLMSGSADGISRTSGILGTSMYGKVEGVSGLPAVGQALAIWKGMAGQTVSGVLSERYPAAPTLDSVLLRVDLDGVVALKSSFAAGVLNILMPAGVGMQGISITGNSAGMRVVPPIWLESYVPTSSSLASSSMAVQVGLAAPAVAAALSSTGAKLNPLLTASALSCLSSTSLASSGFGSYIPFGTSAIDSRLSAASAPGKFVVNSPYNGSISSVSIASAYFMGVQVGLASSTVQASCSLVGARMASNIPLAAPALAGALSTASPATGKGPGLLSLGAADSPKQFQEYSRYPIPTGTSLASPVDEDGTPVHYSHSVFGSTVFRVPGGVGVVTDVSVQLASSQLGSPTQYSIAPDYYKTMVLLRTSILDTSSTQRALFGVQAVGPNVDRIADYANLPRSYTSSVGSMGAGSASILGQATATAYGTYAVPSQSPAVLFFGSSLVRHNYNQAASVSENAAIATDYYYPSTFGRKLAKSRVESTVGSYSEGLSPIYSSSAFRLLTFDQYLQYSAANAAFQANSVILPQDGATASAHIHGSDSMFAFLPIKQGAKYQYSYYHPSSSVPSATVSAAGFLGSGSSLEFTVSLLAPSGPVPPDQLYSADADCLLRILIYPYTASGSDSFVYVDVPVLGVSVNDPTRVSVDSSYRWFLEQCLPLGAYYDAHTIRSMKDLYSGSNNAPNLSSKAVLAVSRPVVRITGDQGESQDALLSTTGDRNLIVGEFSLAISRSDQAFNTDVKVNVEATEPSAMTVYTDLAAPASSVGSFDPNSLHLFVKADGSLACRRSIPSYNGSETSTSLDAILPGCVKEFIAASGSFSKVKVGENVIALLSSGSTGKKLFLWGYNTYGQLDVPAAVDANFLANGYISNVKEFDLNSGHVAVILDNGHLYSWGCSKSTVWSSSGSMVRNLDIGENYSVAVVDRYDSSNPGTPVPTIEQYGNAPAASSIPSGITVATPTQVWTAGLAGQVVYAGKVLACGKNHTVLLKSDGTVVCWGNNNTYGQCTVPVGLTSIVAVDAGDNHTVALKSDGTVYAWGLNTSGQTTIPSGLKAKIISAGGNFCAAVRTAASTDVSSTVGAIVDEEVDNTVACWGDNSKGQCTVPVTEGVSYDPSVYKYRMRFWSVQCGWDHVVGIRMDDVQSKWSRDHSELSRYLNYYKIALPLKTSGGTAIFSSISGLFLDTSSGTTVLSSRFTGFTYSVTETSPGSGVWRTSEVTAGSAKYRIRYESNTPAAYVERSAITPTSWSDLTFNTRYYDFSQTVFSGSTSDIRPLSAGWDGGVSSSGLTLPSWTPYLGYDDSSNTVTYMDSAQTTGEYASPSYVAADNSDIDLNWTFTAWGNPMAYSTSVDKSDYLPYYSDPDISSVVVNDLKPAPASNVPSYPIDRVFSYVGYGKGLGYDLLLGGESGGNLLIGPAELSSALYLGPRTLQTCDISNGLTTSASGVYGSYAVMLGISGTPRYFNRPMPVSASAINAYAEPEAAIFGSDHDVLCAGFNNKSVYVERFGYSLPAGYSIVANGSGSLPAGTINSPTGYHLLFVGTIVGSVRTIVLTGAYGYINSVNLPTIMVPYDPVYGPNSGGGSGIPYNWLSTLGILVKQARVVKHGLSLRSNRKAAVPGKHMTSFVELFDGLSKNTAQVYGLAISASSPQSTGGVQPLLNVAPANALQYFAKYRSALSVWRTGFSVGTLLSSKFGVAASAFGDNSKGQLNLALFGKFSLKGFDLQVPYTLDNRWMMDFGQTTIGHTENPSLAYGFSKVSCGQFHTLAIDEDGSVHAWGLNYALNAPKTEFIDWDPFSFGSTNCLGDTREAKVSGYFSSIPGEEPGATSCSPLTFDCNRSVSVFPTGASNNGNLSSRAFAYPNIFADWNSDSYCLGSYLTSGLMLFDINSFNDADTVLVSQTVSGPGLKIGLEQSAGQARIYVSEKGSQARQYSEYFPSNPSLLFLSFPDFSPLGAAGISVAAKVNGKYVKWAGDSYTSSPASKISYRKFVDAVGDVSQVAPAYSSTIRREFMPTAGLTKLIAGDTFFAGLYLGDANPKSQVRGTFVSSMRTDGYSYDLGVSAPATQGPMLPTLDLAGPKRYFISKVSRTYKQIGGTVPAGAVYSGAVAATIKYTGDASPNFKIYYGAEYSEPAENMIYTIVDPTTGPGRWPKIVFPTDPEWSSGVPLSLPTQVKVYRRRGNTYGSNDFDISSQDFTFTPEVYPYKPIVDVSTELGHYVVYDQATKRILPQAYFPSSNLGILTGMHLGEQCAFAIQSDNTLASWGQNHFQQRANADALGFTSWRQVACSSTWSLALSTSGVVRKIGTGQSNVTPPADLGTCLYVAAANASGAAIVQDGVNSYGAVRCWGTNLYGECNVPADLGFCTMVSAGNGHFAALRTDGKVVCWGRNDAGQCTVPVAAQSGVVKVVCGYLHTVALKSTGQVVCWGSNTFGQCTVPGTLGTGCLDIGAGQYYTIAVKSDGNPRAWGDDTYGLVSLLAGVNSGGYIRVGSGWSADYAVTAKGTINSTFISGNVSTNHLELPTTSTRNYAIFNPVGYTSVGPYKHVAVSLPSGATQQQIDAAVGLIPVSIRAKNADDAYSSSELSGLEHAIEVASGDNCFFAIKAATYAATQGTIVGWGQATGDGLFTIPSGSNFTSISCRNRHAAAIKSDGTIACWGLNTSGQAAAQAGTYSMVSCGDTFTAAIDSSTNKLKVWGSISSVPAPYSDIQYSTVSSGRSHIVGRALTSYSALVPGGTFSVPAGSVLAFGDNSKGQCNIPGFSYSPLNNGIACPAVAGGDFTSYSLPSYGFDLTSYVGSGTNDKRAAIFTTLSGFEDFTSQFTLLSDKLEGYVIHRAGALCPAVLPLDHPYSINSPTSAVYPNRDPVFEAIQPVTGFLPKYSVISNAISVPSAYARGGAKKARLVGAGRYRYHKQDTTRFPYGAGYSVIVGQNNEVIVFGGDLLPSSCNAALYSPPAEALALRNVASSGLTLSDTVIQLETYRANIYALKSDGDMVQWGYDDVSFGQNSEFYKVNSSKKQYFSLPDDSLVDYLPRVEQYDYSNLAMSYVGGVPGLTESWSVDVFLDRYFDGVRTNLRRFTATGNSASYPIGSPVHFAETFLAVDSWPGSALHLDSQYRMTLVPRGVNCVVDSASMFILNLDTKTAANQRVFVDGLNGGGNPSQAADFLIVNQSGAGYGSASLTSLGQVSVTAVSDQSSGITLSSSDAFTYPSYVRNSYGSSSRLEYVGSTSLVAGTAGRVANPVALLPTAISGAACWFDYSSLSSTLSSSISSWANSVSGGAALTQSSSLFQANVATFNTSYRGAEFDTVSAQVDRMSSAGSVTDSAFTYFIVLKKTNNTANTHCAFGKYAVPTQNNPKTLGLGFKLGAPVLFTGTTHDVATASIGTSPAVMCGYYGSTSDKGIRVNGSDVSSWSSTGAAFYLPSGMQAGYHLGNAIAGATGGASANYHDSLDVYAEIVAFERRLTAQEIEQVEGYLAHKFNLQGNLPSGHTYKSAPASVDKLDVLQSLVLQSPDLLIESNRLTGISGKSETWLGMFEVGVSHKSKRISGGSVLNNHAPVLAEFNLNLGSTLRILTQVVSPVSSVAGNMLVDGHTKYLEARRIASALALSAIPSGPQLPMFGSVKSTSKTSGNLNLRAGLAGSAGSTLRFFGGVDCDGPYGCQGRSELPPDLTVKHGAVVGLVSAVSSVSGSLGKIVTEQFCLVSAKANLSGDTSNTLALYGNISGRLSVLPAATRYLNTDLGFASVFFKSSNVVCAGNFSVILPSGNKKTMAIPQFPPAPDTGGEIIGPGSPIGGNVSG